MDKKLIALISFVAIIGAAYFATRPPSGVNAPVKDADYYDGMLADMRAMTPEGDNGQWSLQQRDWLTLACQDFAELQSNSEGVVAGHFEIIEICGSVEDQTPAT